ncbi:ARID DNA-binding domain-containing protein [Tanacetum coccineum]
MDNNFGMEEVYEKSNFGKFAAISTKGLYEIGLSKLKTVNSGVMGVWGRLSKPKCDGTAQAQKPVTLLNLSEEEFGNAHPMGGLTFPCKEETFTEVMHDIHLTLSPYSNGILNKWHQSKILGKPLRRTPKFEFEQRKIKRDEEERIGKCIRQITRDCKDMLKKKIEEIEVHNSAKEQSKYKDYDCFYCNEKGHIFKSCPVKIRDDAVYKQSHPKENAEGSICVYNTTQAKIIQNKNMVKCFKCQETGHFANKCPPNNQGQPKISLKYHDSIHFKTKGIVKGTDMETWDDFWYVCTTTNKHLTSNLKYFSNFKEEFLVEKMEDQRKFLFTYGMGEVLIKNGSNGYLIPGVHYAPEVTLNILSISLLKQQGFDINFEGDRCTLEYMFKNQQGQNMDVDRMRQKHNDYLDEYYESLDKERKGREEEMPRYMEDTQEIHTFNEDLWPF